MGPSLQEVQLCAVEQDLALKEACWLELEAELQSTVSSLEKELELERQQHNKEVQEPLSPPGWCFVSPSEPYRVQPGSGKHLQTLLYVILRQERA